MATYQHPGTAVCPLCPFQYPGQQPVLHGLLYTRPYPLHLYKHGGLSFAKSGVVCLSEFFLTATPWNELFHGRVLTTLWHLCFGRLSSQPVLDENKRNRTKCENLVRATLWNSMRGQLIMNTGGVYYVTWYAHQGRYKDGRTDWLIDRLTDWLIDWLIGRLTDWLIDWLIDRWLIDDWLMIDW